MNCSGFEMADYHDNHDQKVSASAKYSQLINNLLTLARTEKYSVEIENMFHVPSL
jgi:hypothetical protein